MSFLISGIIYIVIIYQIIIVLYKSLNVISSIINGVYGYTSRMYVQTNNTEHIN